MAPGPSVELLDGVHQLTGHPRRPQGGYQGLVIHQVIYTYALVDSQIKDAPGSTILLTTPPTGHLYLVNRATSLPKATLGLYELRFSSTSASTFGGTHIAIPQQWSHTFL